MPSYSYQCEQKHRQDVTHSIKDNPEIICGVCQGLMQRTPQPITPTFVGSGFYRNDKDA
jgi:predicted nucleic acid-binding Zn ribbon protein